MSWGTWCNSSHKTGLWLDMDILVVIRLSSLTAPRTTTNSLVQRSPWLYSGAPAGIVVAVIRWHSSSIADFPEPTDWSVDSLCRTEWC